MSRLRALFALLLGGILGFSLCYWLDERPTHYAFRSRKEIVFVNREGKEVGGIPAGTVVFSSEPLGSADLGWSGYVTISMGTGSEAEPFLEPIKNIYSRTSEHWLRGEARSSDARPRPGS